MVGRGLGIGESGIGNRESEKPGPRVAWVFAGRQGGRYIAARERLIKRGAPGAGAGRQPVPL
ncbi:hypothetical protein Xmlh_14440 [Xanthomonas axonopodis pv. melhusii]|uniref:Uncharacterized protein n=1 Tax=Xanthomonas axonopodis pv. melhusii TaxID=487834 RepID=A0A1T1NXS0_9XANT|nr:hypothetical protein Xmlh_14440 [Xanthomonas axonopodis pv. melhusii]